MPTSVDALWASTKPIFSFLKNKMFPKSARVYV